MGPKKTLSKIQNLYSTGKRSDSTEGDTMFLYLYTCSCILAGLVVHSFIITVNVNDWLRGGSVTPVDHIITFLGISRLFTQCALTIYVIVLSTLLKIVYSHVALYIMNVIFSFFIYSNIWLTSLLSIVFCLKISTLRTRLFLYLRRMIDQRTEYFIVALGLLSTMNSFLPLFLAISEVTNGGTDNTTMENLTECNLINFTYSHTISVSIPLLFCCFSFSLLFSSLYQHTMRMKMSGNLSINLETYYSAMKFVSINFLYNIIYFTGHFIDLFYYYVYCVDFVWLYIFLGFLPALHSSYLIYRTAKLRSHMSKVLHNVIDFLFQRKDPKTREEIN